MFIGLKKTIRFATLATMAAGSALLLSAPASAATDTSNMTVSATVSANCDISAGPLAFGTYDPVITNASANLDGTATLTVTCTSGAAANISLGQGSNAAVGSTDAAPSRRMLSGASYLSYALYQDSARTTVWGNDTTTDAAYTGTGAATSVTVYGRVPSGQNVPSGSYSDTVVATITF